MPAPAEDPSSAARRAANALGARESIEENLRRGKEGAITRRLRGGSAVTRGARPRLSPVETAPASGPVPRPFHQPLDCLIPSPLPRSADALLPVARPAGGNQVGGRGRAAASPGLDVVDFGGAGAAIPAGPLVPLQDGAPQQRMDPPLPRIARSRIPVKKGIGGMGSHKRTVEDPQPKRTNPQAGVCFSGGAEIRTRIRGRGARVSTGLAGA